MTKTNSEVSGAAGWPATSSSQEALKDVCLQVHSAVQWIARIVNSYAVPSSDGSHMHMTWNADDNAMESGTFEDGMSVELRLPEFALQFKENGERTKHEVLLDDKSPARIEAWTLIELLHRNIERKKYSKVLPYDVSHLLSGDAQDFQTYDNETVFAEFTDCLSQAAEIISEVSGNAVEKKLGTCPGIQISPRDLSMFTRVHPDSDRPAVGNYVEIGFCGGVNDLGEPYFYARSTSNSNVETLPMSDISNGVKSKADITQFFDLDARIGSLRGN